MVCTPRGAGNRLASGLRRTFCGQPERKCATNGDSSLRTFLPILLLAPILMAVVSFALISCRCLSVVDRRDENRLDALPTSAFRRNCSLLSIPSIAGTAAPSDCPANFVADAAQYYAASGNSHFPADRKPCQCDHAGRVSASGLPRCRKG